jgi:hypothetical protein
METGFRTLLYISGTGYRVLYTKSIRIQDLVLCKLNQECRDNFYTNGHQDIWLCSILLQQGYRAMFYKWNQHTGTCSVPMESDTGQCSIQIEPEYRALFYTNASRIHNLFCTDGMRKQFFFLYKCSEDTGPCSIQMEPKIQGLHLY